MRNRLPGWNQIMSPLALKKSWQFRTCYQHGRKIVCDHAVIFLHKPPHEYGGLHVGVVASKKVGNAVKRNRAKRVLRHAVRSVESKLNDTDMWVVLVARATILEQTSQQVQDELEQGLAQSDLL